MRILRPILLCSVLLLHGCFFVFIPPGVINAMSDGISGAEGEHCVSSRTKVGDLVRGPDGGMWKVQSLSGTSSRCSNPTIPIRAKLAPA